MLAPQPRPDLNLSARETGCRLSVLIASLTAIIARIHSSRLLLPINRQTPENNRRRRPRQFPPYCPRRLMRQDRHDV